jgi:hypothetical protein
MKDTKRALRRYKSKCKFEKRLKLWVRQGMYFVAEDYTFRSTGGHQLETIRNDIREGKFWCFLKDTSNPCSCWICSGEDYKRLTKHELDKLIEEYLE